MGGEAAFIDAEHALDPIYAEKLGVKIDDLIVSQPDTGEQALEITEQLIRSGAIDVIVIDSVAALVPLLQDREESVRTAAAEAIAQVGPLNAAATVSLVEGLSDPDNVVRAQTAEALGTIGAAAEAAAPALVEAMADGNGGVRAKAVEALDAWLAVRSQLAREDETALFVGARGRRIAPAVVGQRLRDWGKRLGIPVHPHMLRHSFASHILESSGDLRGVQELLGHADIATTQIYTHLDFQHLAKVYDAAHPRARRKGAAATDDQGEES